MSVPASTMGQVLSGSQATPGAAQPTATSTPVTGTAAPSSWLDKLNPFSGLSNFLPNAGLVVLGVVLAISALIISNKGTIVQVATTAAKVAA